MDAIVQLKRRSLFETSAGYPVTGASGCAPTAPIPCEPRCLHVERDPEMTDRRSVHPIRREPRCLWIERDPAVSDRRAVHPIRREPRCLWIEPDPGVPDRRALAARGRGA